VKYAKPAKVPADGAAALQRKPTPPPPQRKVTAVLGGYEVKYKYTMKELSTLISAFCHLLPL
jgi:hypothetical protein